MAGKRCKVRRGADGVWFARLYLGRSVTGKPVRPSKRFPEAVDEADAQRMADEWAEEVRSGKYARHAKLVDLLDEYADDCERNGASPNSVRQYRMINRLYVARYLPRATPRDVDVLALNRFEQRLLMGKDDGGAGLSRNSVLVVHSYLRAAFNKLVDAGVVDVNPMVYVSKPSPERHEAEFVDEWDFPRIHDLLVSRMSAAEDESGFAVAVYAFAAWLSLVTGMRVGETCAVRRRDVNLAAPSLRVGGTVIEERGRRPYRRDVTKGRKGRTLALTLDNVDVIMSMTRAIDRRVGRLGPSAPLVTLDGSYLAPSGVSGVFSCMAADCGLPAGTRFHSLRHTHASWLIANGCDIKTVSERLGHSDVAVTLKVYGHLMPGRDAAAAQVFEEAAKRAAGKGGERL